MATRRHAGGTRLVGTTCSPTRLRRRPTSAAADSAIDESGPGPLALFTAWDPPPSSSGRSDGTAAGTRSGPTRPTGALSRRDLGLQQAAAYPSAAGTVFRVDAVPPRGRSRPSHVFTGPDGASPDRPIVVTRDGRVIGGDADGQGRAAAAWSSSSFCLPRRRSEASSDEIEGLIDDGTLKLGQGKSLVGKLELALYMLEWGNTKKAITMLEAFIQEVEAFERRRDPGTGAAGRPSSSPPPRPRSRRSRADAAVGRRRRALGPGQRPAVEGLRRMIAPHRGGAMRSRRLRPLSFAVVLLPSLLVRGRRAARPDLPGTAPGRHAERLRRPPRDERLALALAEPHAGRGAPALLHAGGRRARGEARLRPPADPRGRGAALRRVGPARRGGLLPPRRGARLVRASTACARSWTSTSCARTTSTRGRSRCGPRPRPRSASSTSGGSSRRGSRGAPSTRWPTSS